MTKNDLEIWKALYIDRFDTHKYLYHYTSFEAAIRILYGNTLLFGKLSNANDITESKIRISYENSADTPNKQYYKECKTITDYLIGEKDGFQILCFSMDTCVKERKKSNYLQNIMGNEAYYDVSGRGFALPRMWAQYANDHKGLCLIFNKDTLIEKVKSERSFFKAGPVKYKDILSTYHIKEKQVNSLFNKIKNESNGNLPYLTAMKNTDFLNYNFFEKSSDWSNEQEYRIIIYTNSRESERQQISNISDAIEGIVYGERMDEIYKEVLSIFFKKLFKKNKNIHNKDINERIKQICFNEYICRLK